MAVLENFPLTAVQRDLWFLTQAAPGDNSYNVHLGLRITGRPDVQALEAVLAALRLRHPVLRTRFVVVDDEPAAIVCPDTAVQLTVTPVAGRWTEAERAAVRESAAPIDIATGTPMRASLFSVSEDEHLLLLVFHHIAVDWWSLRIIERDLGLLYSGAELPGLSVDYADYARYQHDLFEDPQWMESSVRHWRGVLSGVPPVVPLPLDRPRPRRRKPVGRAVAIEVPADVVERLTRAGRECYASLYMTLLAGLGASLASACGCDDLVVGMPVAGRHRPGYEMVVGVFARMVPVRVTVDTAAEFTSLLATTRDRVLNALDHSEIPLREVIADLGIRPDMSCTPLIQVTFQLLQAPRGRPEERQVWNGLVVEPWSVPHNGTSRFDIEVQLTETAGGALTGTATYATDIFDHTTIENLVVGYRTLLSAVAQHSGSPIERAWLR